LAVEASAKVLGETYLIVFVPAKTSAEVAARKVPGGSGGPTIVEFD
jgi:hypothetical protein